MCLFSFTYWDRHYNINTDDIGEVFSTPRDKGWYKFKMFIDVNERRIDRFYSYVIFNEDDDPIECTAVMLTDGDIYYCVNKIETFESNYREKYLSLFKPDITD